jgi:uncharacterized damage-inducible protein DinB
MLTKLRHLWDHARWAEGLPLTTFHDQPGVTAEALRELGHIIGAGELWLSRLEGRASRAAIWPILAVPELQQLFFEVDRGYTKYLGGLEESDLARDRKSVV